jgi:hypothetical protein
MGFGSILASKKAFQAIFTTVVSMYCVSFNGPFLSKHLRKAYGVSEKNMGYCFLMASLPYLISCVILPPFLKKVPRRL